MEASPRTIRIKNISYITFSKSYNTPSAHSGCLPHTRGHRYCICSTKVIWAQGKLCPRYLIPERYQQTKQSFLFLAAADVPGIREAEKKLRKKKKNIQHVRVVSATRKITRFRHQTLTRRAPVTRLCFSYYCFITNNPNSVA